MIPTPRLVPSIPIDCGACKACCHQWVILTEEEIGYEVERIATPKGVVRLLKRQEDGACIYLTEQGCGIYEQRPACCRRFHCGRWYETLPRDLIKEIQKNGDPKDRRMLREGKRRARRGLHA